MGTVSIAARFVDSVLKHEPWDEVKELPPDEAQVLLETVEAAGFEPKYVVPGRLKGDYLDQDGSRTGKTYSINSLCPFKVVSREDHDHYFSTGWLDCALRRVIGGSRRSEGREQLIETVRLEIERSVPFQPIQLTPDGDLLCEYPPSPLAFGLAYFVDHTRDPDKLGSCVGAHKYCNGFMDRRRATGTHDAIVCRGCHLRVLFPKKVQTYGELRRALETHQHTLVSA